LLGDDLMRYGMLYRNLIYDSLPHDGYLGDDLIRYGMLYDNLLQNSLQQDG
jgi:hypothetical protein